MSNWWMKTQMKVLKHALPFLPCYHYHLCRRCHQDSAGYQHRLFQIPGESNRVELRETAQLLDALGDSYPRACRDDLRVLRRMELGENPGFLLLRFVQRSILWVLQYVFGYVVVALGHLHTFCDKQGTGETFSLVVWPDELPCGFSSCLWL